MSQVFVRSEEGFRMSIHLRNHMLFADETLEDGGADTAPTPPEILLGALGACMCMTTKMYARRKHWPLEDVQITLESERFNKEDYPAYLGASSFVTEIRYNIEFLGPLTAEQTTRLSEIAHKCPVHRTLENPIYIVEGLHGAPVEES